MDEVSRRMRIHTPPLGPLDPGIYAGVPGAPITLDDVLARRHVCFSPDELKSLLERARNSSMATEDDIKPKEYIVTARVDDATMFFLRAIQAKYNIGRSTIIRLGIYLLREVLEKEGEGRV